MMMPGLADQFPKLKEGHCKHIRSKEMFYQIERLDVPDYSARMYWCQHTQLPLGPDNKPCEMGHCTAERACFERI